MQSHLELFNEFDPELRASVERFLSQKGCRQPAAHTVGIINKAWDKIFNGFDKARDPDRPYGWMWTVAKNAACDHLRQCINEEDFSSQERKFSDESGEGKIPFDPAEVVSRTELIFENLLTEEILRSAAEISPDFSDLLPVKLVLRQSGVEG